MINGLLALMNHPDEQLTGPINLGNPNEFTIAELARKTIELTKSKSKLKHQPLPQDDPKQRCPDISKAKIVLGWHPSTELGDGLLKVIEYFLSEQNSST